MKSNLKYFFFHYGLRARLIADSPKSFCCNRPSCNIPVIYERIVSPVRYDEFCGRLPPLARYSRAFFLFLSFRSGLERGSGRPSPASAFSPEVGAGKIHAPIVEPRLLAVPSIDRSIDRSMFHLHRGRGVQSPRASDAPSLHS